MSILTEAYAESSYMHMAGAGDQQALSHLLGQLDHEDDDTKLNAVAGFLTGNALINFQTAVYYAERIIAGETLCDYCGEAEATSTDGDDNAICDDCAVETDSE